MVGNHDMKGNSICFFLLSEFGHFYSLKLSPPALRASKLAFDYSSINIWFHTEFKRLAVELGVNLLRSNHILVELNLHTPIRLYRPNLHLWLLRILFCLLTIFSETLNVCSREHETKLFVKDEAFSFQSDSLLDFVNNFLFGLILCLNLSCRRFSVGTHFFLWLRLSVFFIQCLEVTIIYILHFIVVRVFSQRYACLVVCSTIWHLECELLRLNLCFHFSSSKTSLVTVLLAVEEGC